MRRATAIATAAAAAALALVSTSVRAQGSAPPAAVAAARAAMSDTTRGKSLRVAVVTVGQGDAVWERYGHNLLWIRNDATGESLLWEWGVFDFNDPGFITRFLFGNARYRVDSAAADPRFRYFQSVNREVIAQELEFTAGQRAALDAFVRANVLPEHQYYTYDYFLDNCSTRLRDALDAVLGGAIRASLEPRSGDLTYRGETLRLNQHNPWQFLGLDLALGFPADRTMSPWEAAFVPMRLRDDLRTVYVRVAGRGAVPLVSSERILIATTRTREPDGLDATRAPTALLAASLAVVLVALGLGLLARRGGGAVHAPGAAIVAVAVAVHLVLGLLTSLVVFMWFFTRHAFWAWNPHVLLATPVSLAVVVSLLRSRTRRPVRKWVERYHLVMVGCGFAMALVILGWHGRHLTPTAQLLLIWANASWLMHASLGLAVIRVRGAPAIGPDA